MSQIPGSLNTGARTRAFEGILELMSELFFASLEPGNNYVTQPIILNTALYYALGYAQGNYVNKPANKQTKKQQPAYIEETGDAADTIYVSPARPIGEIHYTSELSNARSDEYIQYNRLKEQKNSPTGKFGTRKQIQSGARFRFFVLTFDGVNLTCYISVLGKSGPGPRHMARSPGRVIDGEFLMNHPFSLMILKRCLLVTSLFAYATVRVIERGRFIEAT